MESTPDRAVNYLQFVDHALEVVNQNEEFQARPPQKQEEAYLCLSIDIYTKITLQDDK